MRHDINRNKNNIIQDYRNGTSIKELTEKYNTSYSTIRNRLLKWISIKELNQIQQDKKTNQLQNQIEISKQKTNTGYFRVYKAKSKTCKQGYVYIYGYYDEEGNKRRISRVNIEELEIAVKEKQLPWIKFTQEKEDTQ